MYIIKVAEKSVRAYCLGAETRTEQKLVTEGKIKRHKDGRYELFSQEAVNGVGEFAVAGDFFKVDSSGFPYPNGREWFLAHHIHIGGDEYLQRPEPLKAWTVDEPMCEEIEFLLVHGRLAICREETEHYFRAFLWGAPLGAKEDAVVVFYRVDKDPDGNILDIEFNFLAREEFEKTYRIVTE